MILTTMVRWWWLLQMMMAKNTVWRGETRWEEWQEGRRSQKVCCHTQIWGRKMRRFSEEKYVERSIQGDKGEWMAIVLDSKWQEKDCFEQLVGVSFAYNTLDGDLKLYGFNGLLDWLSISLSAVFDFRFLCVMRGWVSMVTQLLSYNTMKKVNEREESGWWEFFSHRHLSLRLTKGEEDRDREGVKHTHFSLVLSLWNEQRKRQEKMAES